MVRSISPGALTKIAEKTGSEPIAIIEVNWIDGDAPTPYADRDLGTIPGRILELSVLDNVISVSRSNDSQQLSVTLDDTDGAIKAILDAHDVHQRDVRVYQHFEGLALADRFLLFRGKISSPVVWSEGSRTVRFDIVSQIEDAEIGFSPEEGEFENIPEDLIGRPWPMVFGTAVHVEAVPLSEPAVGTLATGVGMIDFLLPFRFFALNKIVQFIDDQIGDWLDANSFSSVTEVSQSGDEQLQKQLEGFLTNKQRFVDSRSQTLGTISEQGTTIAAPFSASDGSAAILVEPSFSSFRVFGGESFPRGVVTLDINGAQFTGAFQGVTDEFVVHLARHPRQGEPLVTPRADGQSFESGPFGFSRFVPNGNIVGETAGYFFANPGAQVTLNTAEPQPFVASITPGTVEGVKAFIQANGRRFLIDVPEDFYAVKTETYGSVTATIVELDDALSKRADLNWDDQIYVTFKSSVGPNTVDVIEYLIEQNTDFGIDTTTFDAVRARLANYPSHFALTDRKQVLQALNEIAFQARCAIFLKDGTFFLRYLPAEPPSVATIRESDIEVGTLEIRHTPTEDLVTKLVARWRATGAQAEENRVILRHNVKKYGTKERSFDWYIYNNVDLVIKSATYWLIRMANTWKMVRFSTPLNKLHVETFDAVTLSFSTPFVASGDVLAVVENGGYNSADRSLEFEVWTPVKAGTLVPYLFGYPADVDQDLIFPTQEEIDAGLDGGTGVGRSASGVLPPRHDIRRGVRASYDGNPDPFGFEAAKRRNSDRGAASPSDAGDDDPGAPATGQPVLFDERLAGPDTPVFDNTGFYKVTEPTLIDIATTKITDSRDPASNGSNIATLATFFAEISDGRLKMSTGATVVDANNRQIQAEFDFKYDAEGEKFGAGTAFLKE